MSRVSLGGLSDESAAPMQDSDRDDEREQKRIEQHRPMEMTLIRRKDVTSSQVSNKIEICVDDDVSEEAECKRFGIAYMPFAANELEMLQVVFGAMHETTERLRFVDWHLTGYNRFYKEYLPLSMKDTRGLFWEVFDILEHPPKKKSAADQIKANARDRAHYKDMNAMDFDDMESRKPNAYDRFCKVSRPQHQHMVEMGYAANGTRYFVSVDFEFYKLSRPMTLSPVTGHWQPLYPHDAVLQGQSYQSAIWVKVHKKLHVWKYDSFSADHYAKTVHPLPYDGEIIIYDTVPTVTRSCMCHSTEEAPPHRPKSQAELLRMRFQLGDPGAGMIKNGKKTVMKPHEYKETHKIFVCVGIDGELYCEFVGHRPTNVNYSPDRLFVTFGTMPSNPHGTRKRDPLSRYKVRKTNRNAAAAAGTNGDDEHDPENNGDDDDEDEETKHQRSFTR